MLSKLKKAVLFIQEEILVISSIFMFTLLFIGAVMRVVFKTDFYGLEEIVMLFAFWQYFIGTSYAGYEDTHIQADMLTPYIKSEKAKHVLALVKYILSLVLCALTTVWCVQFISWYFVKMPVTAIFRIPLAVTHFPILVGFTLWTFYIIGHIIVTITEMRKGGEAR